MNVQNKMQRGEICRKQRQYYYIIACLKKEMARKRTWEHCSFCGRFSLFMVSYPSYPLTGQFLMGYSMEVGFQYIAVILLCNSKSLVDCMLAVCCHQLCFKCTSRCCFSVSSSSSPSSPSRGSSPSTLSSGPNTLTSQGVTPCLNTAGYVSPSAPHPPELMEGYRNVLHRPSGEHSLA